MKMEQQPKKQVFDTEILQVIGHFEKMTGVKVKDYYDHNDRLHFVIETGGLMRALGKDGANVKKLSTQLNRRLKISEYNPDVKLFIRNMIHPLKVSKTEVDDPEPGTITLYDDDVKTKGLIIGAKAQNLRFYERVVQKYFPDVKEIKVV
ncbi:NusA-like transcription termination signal-binding factor [Candidatus Woesearchaeota archaeon]|nr:NusA-like transcription termination signal-binding factor [Candidatus Woesearchaeota archaeon]